eukprot:scaffold126_cov266-Prasinococcus_capsulatus_cf.AAC.3
MESSGLNSIPVTESARPSSTFSTASIAAAGAAATHVAAVAIRVGSPRFAGDLLVVAPRVAFGRVALLAAAARARLRIPDPTLVLLRRLRANHVEAALRAAAWLSDAIGRASAARRAQLGAPGVLPPPPRGTPRAPPARSLPASVLRRSVGAAHQSRPAAEQCNERKSKMLMQRRPVPGLDINGAGWTRVSGGRAAPRRRKEDAT